MLLDQIKEAQFVGTKLSQQLKLAQQGENNNFNVDVNDCLSFCNWICVLDSVKLKKLILHEAHNGSFTMHLGSALVRIILMVRNEKGDCWICC